MNPALIYNRDGGLGNDGWVHLVPKGVLHNKEHGIDQVLDDTALDSILAGLNEDKRRLGNRWPGLYMGEEHFIYDANKSSEAFAWVKEFEKRADGIWGKPELTDVGDPAIKNKRYKYTSFVADPRDVEMLAPQDGKKRARILKIETVGFTNFANGKHLLAPITNRSEPDGPAKQFRQGGLSGTPAAENADNKTKNRTMKSVATQLKLSADASEEAVLAEVIKVMNRVDTAEADTTKFKNRVTELETSNTTLLTEQVDGILAEHGIKEEKVVNRLKTMLVPLKNRAERETALAELGHKPLSVAGKGKETQGNRSGSPRLLNREDGKTPEDRSGGGNETDDQALSGKIKNRASELQGATPTRSWDSCWSQAQREVSTKQ